MYEGVDCQMVQKSPTALSYPKSTIPGSHCIPLGKQTWIYCLIPAGSQKGGMTARLFKM